MSDPLAEAVALLQPAIRLAKVVFAGGRWAVHRTEAGEPFYCAVLDGACRLAVAGRDPVVLGAQDFVLLPAAQAFSVTSVTPPAPGEATPLHPDPAAGRVRLGDPTVAADVQLLVGHCTLAAPDAALLATLLPDVIHIPGAPRLVGLVQMLSEEARAERPARALVLARLLEVLFIEAVRASGAGEAAGLARGLADPRLAQALRAMHRQPDIGWDVAALAREASLSRSAFFERFQRAVGLAPMAYLQAWRMALAKSLLRAGRASVARIAEQVGYGSASAFSVAFARATGMPPGAWVRQQGTSAGSR